MIKQYLDISNLLTFCEKNVVETNNELYVSMTANFDIDDNEKKEYRRELIPFVCKAYHDNLNANGSRIDPETFIDNTKSIEFRPVLANIVEDDDGNKDFGSHDYHYETNDNGEDVLVYDEKPVGVVTNYGFAYDEKAGVNRAVVTGFLFERYAPEVTEIFRQRNNVSCSVELCIKDYHFKDGTLTLDDYFVSGVTLLGKNHGAGMVGSEMTLESFSKVNNSAVFNILENLDKDELARLQDNWTRVFLLSDSASEKGEGEMENLEIEETLEKDVSVVTKEDVNEDSTFDRTVDEKWALINRKFGEWVESKGIKTTFNNFVFESEIVYQDPYYNYFKVGYVADDEGNVSFSEEVIPVELKFISEADKEELENLKTQNNTLESKVAELSQELESVRLREEAREKESVLSDPVFNDCLDSEEFSEVIKSKDEMSLEEFKLKIDLAFAQYQKSNFKPDVAFKQIVPTVKKSKKSSRYGNIFEEEK